MKNPLIDQTSIDALCRVYSRLTGEGYQNDKAREAVKDQLDAEMGKLQTMLRRKLGAACAGSTIMRSRVYASINHAARPVTILPIATATILVRKGVEVSLQFIATEENIVAESKQLKNAIASFKI